MKIIFKPKNQQLKDTLENTEIYTNRNSPARIRVLRLREMSLTKNTSSELNNEHNLYRNHKEVKNKWRLNVRHRSKSKGSSFSFVPDTLPNLSQNPSNEGSDYITELKDEYYSDKKFSCPLIKHDGMLSTINEEVLTYTEIERPKRLRTKWYNKKERSAFTKDKRNCNAKFLTRVKLPIVFKHSSKTELRHNKNKLENYLL